jgi:hypothetical protein
VDVGVSMLLAILSRRSSFQPFSAVLSHPEAPVTPTMDSAVTPPVISPPKHAFRLPTRFPSEYISIQSLIPDNSLITNSSQKQRLPQESMVIFPISSFGIGIGRSGTKLDPRI